MFSHALILRQDGDVIHTATLREQLAESPGDLANLVLVLAMRVGGEEEAARLADECVDWIESNLPSDYPWRGNVRELEQCVRNVMIRGAYQPLQAPDSVQGSSGGGSNLDQALAHCDLDADALLRRYCTHAYARYGSYEETARRLGLDRRTVKAKLDAELLETLRG
jgi:DNA-binding NtrC family response regulator